MPSSSKLFLIFGLFYEPQIKAHFSSPVYTLIEVLDACDTVYPVSSVQFKSIETGNNGFVSKLFEHR